MKIFFKKFKIRKNFKKSRTLRTKVANIRRVTKVTKGGKKFTFRVIVIVGNFNSTIGFGIGKSQEISQAIKKAANNAKKDLINIPRTKHNSINRLIIGDYCTAKILIKPAKIGTGIIAGGSTRLIMQLAGLKNVIAKQLGSNNILNNTNATFNALKKITKSLKVSKMRQIPIENFYL
jgi:small subunit ribosomal protein S5